MAYHLEEASVEPLAEALEPPEVEVSALAQVQLAPLLADLVAAAEALSVALLVPQVALAEVFQREHQASDPSGMVLSMGGA